MSYLPVEFLVRMSGTVVAGEMGYQVGPETSVMMRLFGKDVTIRRGGTDLFAAFQEARRHLERAGYIPLVAGARRDCYPADAARTYGQGDHVHALAPGRPPAQDDLVYLLAPATPDEVATIAEQDSWFRRWARSVPRS